MFSPPVHTETMNTIMKTQIFNMQSKVDQFENISVQPWPRSTQMIFDKTPDKNRLEQMSV